MLGEKKLKNVQVSWLSPVGSLHGFENIIHRIYSIFRWKKIRKIINDYPLTWKRKHVVLLIKII